MNTTELMQQVQMALAANAEEFVTKAATRRLATATEALHELRRLYPTGAEFVTTNR
jgi:hypothetical protein